MGAPEFLAVLHADGGEQAAVGIARRHAPESITRLRLDGGGLLLCRWDASTPAARGAVATIDGSGGAPETPLPARIIDAAHAPAGLRAAARQHRSYLWLDEGRLTCWTDHLGLARVYHARVGDCLLLCDEPLPLAGADAAPDPSGICSFLVNGHMVHGRTVFAGVGSLPLASVIELSPAGMTSRPYWTHQPGADIRADRREVAREMWARLEAAVLAETEGRETVIALSGGCDSTALLGILHGAGRPVTTFSFALGDPRPGSDADVARRRSARLGIEHRLYRFDEGFEIAGMLRSHMASGLVMRKPCYEAAAYDQAIRDTAVRNGDAVMMFGDEAYGQGAFRIGNGHELLGAAALKSPAILARLAPHLPRDRAERIGAALWRDYEHILAQPRPAVDRDAMDMLFLDHYLRANMVEMRRRIVGRRQPISLPHLELAVIDTARHLPARLRTQKRFFEAVAHANLPELFRIPSAVDAQAQPSVTIEMRRQHRSLAEMASRLERGIPGLLSPAELTAALDHLHATPIPELPPVQKAVTAAMRVIARRELIPPALMDALRRRYWCKFEAGADAAGLLMRALQVAMIFDQAAADARRPIMHAASVSA